MEEIYGESVGETPGAGVLAVGDIGERETPYQGVSTDVRLVTRLPKPQKRKNSHRHRNHGQSAGQKINI